MAEYAACIGIALTLRTYFPGSGKVIFAGVEYMSMIVQAAKSFVRSRTIKMVEI